MTSDKSNTSNRRVITDPAVGQSVAVSTERVILNRLSDTDIKDVQKIAATQIELIGFYHNLVLDQARKSFQVAVIAAVVGFVFLLAAIGYIVFGGDMGGVTSISVVAGVLLEFIAGINFYLYGRTSLQLKDFHTSLSTTQTYLLANSMIESLDVEGKNKARTQLVQQMVQATMPITTHTSTNDDVLKRE